MRICSFLPSASEMVYALGLDDSLHGVTCECDYPPKAKEKPIVVLSSINSSHVTSSEVDKAASRSLFEGRSLYIIDKRKLLEADLDLIITQGVCEVCAPSETEVAQVLEILRREPLILSLEPKSLDDVVEDISRVGLHTGRAEAAKDIVDSLRIRIQKVRSLTDKLPKRRIFCSEWLDPIFNAGHWIREMVSVTGGYDGLASEGESVRIEWSKVVDYDPEVLILMPCGYDVAKMLSEIHSIASKDGFGDLRAVREGEVYAVNRSAYFSRPGPRIVDGLDILVKILHPEVFDGHIPSNSVKRLTTEMIV